MWWPVKFSSHSTYVQPVSTLPPIKEEKAHKLTIQCHIKHLKYNYTVQSIVSIYSCTHYMGVSTGNNGCRHSYETLFVYNLNIDHKCMNQVLHILLRQVKIQKCACMYQAKTREILMVMLVFTRVPFHISNKHCTTVLSSVCCCFSTSLTPMQ